MGLDMYARTTAETVATPTDFEVEASEELHYWRKHPNLHGWMQQLYARKGGTDDNFNLVNLALGAEDLDKLEADIRAGALPQTNGFFFGQSDGSETAGDLAFIEKARAAIEAGRRVYYTSWW